MTAKKKLLDLAIAGLSERAMQRLQSFLQEIADDQCSIVELDSAQAIIVDVDSDKFDWTQFRARYPHHPTLILSRQRPEINDVIWVPKPIMEVALSEAINWASSQVRQDAAKGRAATGSRHGLDMVLDPAQLAPATGRRDEDSTLNVSKFDDSQTLLRSFIEATKRATESKRIVLLTVGDDGELAILPRDSLVAISVNAATLLDWARDETIGSKIEIRGLAVEQERKLLARMEQYRDVVAVEALLWKLGVWTARGRLPEGVDPESRYYLRCWPNFTRLMVVPHAVRIAAMGVTEPMPLLFIADTLEIAPADVFSFYYSAMAVGLAGLAQREDDYLLANRAVDGDAHSGVKRAVAHIGRSVG